MPPRVKIASWPDDAPSRFDDNIISISAGNSNLNWALHTNFESSFVPVLFWRTPPVLRDEQNTEDACTVLARHLPKQVHSIIYGSEEAEHNKKVASEVAARRKAPLLAVYICSTNHEHENGIAFLFKDVPSRVVRLQNFHFFTPEDGAYETIGVDRVATLFSCKATYPSRHVLCFDCGTAWTYTALDNQGKIVGGGIAPGIGARFRCMADYCDALPEIDHEIYHTVLKDQMKKKKPFPVFAKDTKTAMITSTFTEVANQTRYLVKQFIKKAREEAPDNAEKPIVVVAGGDAPFVIKILEKDFSGMIAIEPGNPVPREEFDVEEAKHLVHYGVGQLLHGVTPQESSDPDERFRDALRYCRVAKRFISKNYDGTDIFRGSIHDIKRGSKLEEDLFDVRYDDGDKEHLEFPEVYDAFKLYLEVGEAENGEKLNVEKISKAIDNMEKQSKNLKEDASKRQEKRTEDLQKEKEAADKRKNAEKASTGKRRKSKEADKKAKKPKTTETDKATMYINKRVAKFFEEKGGQVLYFGIIDKYEQEKGFWHCLYDDSDEEEMDEKDIIDGMKLWQQHRHKDTEFQGTNNTASLVEGLTGEPTAEAASGASAAPENGGTS